MTSDDTTNHEKAYGLTIIGKIKAREALVRYEDTAKFDPNDEAVATTVLCMMLERQKNISVDYLHVVRSFLHAQKEYSETRGSQNDA